MSFCSKVLDRTSLCLDKEVFVKHEQAPTAPKLEKVCLFLYILNICSMKTAIFGQCDNFRSGVLTEMAKRHIYDLGPRPFI